MLHTCGGAGGRRRFRDLPFPGAGSSGEPDDGISLVNPETGEHVHWREKVEAYETTAFNPHRGSGTDRRSCEAAQKQYGGFWGPFLD